MELLKQRIVSDGVVKNGQVLKVDSFLNHQIDVELLEQMARQWKADFADAPVNKILTIEASGIGLAVMLGCEMGLPVVFAKKSSSINIDGVVYATRIQSFTRGIEYDVIVAKRYLGPEDHVLIVDDFLSNGCAMDGLIEICEAAGATVEGVAIAIEKGFMGGGDKLRERGFAVDSLAIIDSMDETTGAIEFR